MKRLISKLNNNEKMLELIHQEGENIKSLPYYKIFGTEEERTNDLEEVRNRKKQYLTERYSILESIGIEVEKQKARVSELERENLLEESLTPQLS
nr:hypothetical protein [uncultured Allomuricauda sp.]